MRPVFMVFKKLAGQPILVVSGSYALAYFLTVTVLAGALIGVSDDPTMSASLIFLPHGVRIISGWLYGWRAAFYILPGAYISHLIRLPISKFSIDALLAPMFGVFCASVCFAGLAYLGWDFRVSAQNKTSWHDILLVGALASVLNAIGTNLLYGNDLRTALGYFVGDILGLVAVMYVLMVGFRLHRLYGTQPK